MANLWQEPQSPIEYAWLLWTIADVPLRKRPAEGSPELLNAGTPNIQN